MPDVVLGKKCRQALPGLDFTGYLGKVGTVAQVQTAAHHRKIDAEGTAIDHGGDDIDIGITR
jgi:hypothetical protein